MDAADIIPAYAAAGLPVLPLHGTRPGGYCSCGRPAGTGPRDCHSPGKHPLTRRGKDDATTDPDQIGQWLARWPACNWGVRPPLGVIVLDIDPRNGGDTALADLEQRHGPLPATLTARTGSGGEHRWLTYRGPARGRLCTGVDVKTNSGYLVAPPSVHACGGTYVWLDDRPAAPTPRWVATVLNPPAPRLPYRPGGRIEPLVRFVAAGPEGERNRRLFWAACRAVEAGIDPAPLIDAAVGVGVVAPAAAATVRSAARAARKVGS